MEEQEPTEGKIDLFGQAKIFSCLRDGKYLAVSSGSLGNLVAGERVAIHCIDTPFVADDLGEGHRHVTSACAHVDTGPTRADAQPIEGSGQWPAVDIVTQSSKLHACTVVTGPSVRRAAALNACADGDSESR
jgi:hypothetical protein